MSPFLKKIVIALVILLIAFGIYMSFSGMSSTSPTTQDYSASLVQNSEKILTDLNKINALTIDETIFADRLFRSLVDTRVTLVESKSGRPNPFASVE